MSISRGRPAIHATAESGWLNDPHGVLWHEDRYHLFVQHVPDATTWQPGIHWGHATSLDLNTWTWQGVALSPADDETGCWTGSVVRGPDGPRIYYTSVAEPDLAFGRLRLARPMDDDLHTWRPEPTVQPLAPSGVDLVAVRDPFVWRSPDGGWRMIAGAGLRGVGGAALHYLSSDGLAWTYDGVFAERSVDEPGEWTGQVWECPALVRVDGHDVLLTSVWHDDVLHHVVAAVGEDDGHRFHARSWQRLTQGDVAYATTSFTDREGRPCVMHWLRERAGHDPASSGWAGAISIPQVLSVQDGVVRLSPHPDLDLSQHVVCVAGVTVVVDADIVEVFGPGGYGAARLAQPQGTLPMTASPARSPAPYSSA